MMALYDTRFGLFFGYNDGSNRNGGHHYGKGGIGYGRVQRNWKNDRAGIEIGGL